MLDAFIGHTYEYKFWVTWPNSCDCKGGPRLTMIRCNNYLTMIRCNNCYVLFQDDECLDWCVDEDGPHKGCGKCGTDGNLMDINVEGRGDE